MYKWPPQTGYRATLKARLTLMRRKWPPYPQKTGDNPQILIICTDGNRISVDSSPDLFDFHFTCPVVRIRKCILVKLQYRSLWTPRLVKS